MPIRRRASRSRSRRSASVTRARGRRRPSGVYRRVLRAIWTAPLGVKIFVPVMLIVVAWAAANWAYHTVRKPSELFFPVSAALAKSPSETWRTYGRLFTKHSTAVITPEFLAALAQVEGAGNPVARTYWRLRPSQNPFDVYRPASSAVGMYQITDATFREARKYCIRDHAVVEDVPMGGLRSCWFNNLYTRVVPSHAIEMTAALLDRRVAAIVERRRIAASVPQKQNLAAVIHLCGAGAGEAYAARGFQLTGGQRCGDHDVGTYLSRLNVLKRQYARLAGTRERI